MKLIATLVLVIALSACASKPTKPLTVHQRYEVACVGAATAYGVIAAVNNVKPLKASQQKQVLEAKAKIDTRCELGPGEDYPYTATEAVMDELESSAALLKKVEGELR